MIRARWPFPDGSRRVRSWRGRAPGPPSPKTVGRESRVEPLVLDASPSAAGRAPGRGRDIPGGRTLRPLRGAVAERRAPRRRGPQPRPAASAAARWLSSSTRSAATSWTHAQAAALAAEAGALAIVGSNSSDLSMAIAEEAEARGVVQVTNVSTAQDLTFDPATGKQPPLRVPRVQLRRRHGRAPRRVRAGRASAPAGPRSSTRSAATYSTRLARSFVERFQDPARSRVSAEFVYLALETDFRAQLREVQAFAPDVLFLPGLVHGCDPDRAPGRAARAPRRPCSGPTPGRARSCSSGAVPSRPPTSSTTARRPRAFNERYDRTFGQPTQGCRAALAYDAVRAIAAGLQSLGRLAPEDLERQARGHPATAARRGGRRGSSRASPVACGSTRSATGPRAWR